MKLLIGIVTYNSKGTMDRCLSGIFAALPAEINHEIVIHDNNSSDNTSEHIEKNYPDIKLIRGIENHGYAYGVNRISESTDWNYFLILNPDVYLYDDAIDIALEFMRSNSDVALSGANLLDESGNPIHSYGDLLTPEMFVYDFSGYRKIFPRSNWSTYKKVTSEHKPFEAGYVTGAFMLIKKEAWDKVGSFDESFFLYFEDTDWSFRLIQNGGKAMVHPDVRAIHESGASFDKNPVADYFKLKSYFTSAYRYLRKHYGDDKMKSAYEKIIRNTNSKLNILKAFGKGKSDSANRQMIILKIHGEIRDDIFR